MTDRAKVHAPDPDWPRLMQLPTYPGDNGSVTMTVCGHLYDPGIVSDIRDEWTCKTCLRKVARRDEAKGKT